jgi:rhamnosyltransferase
MQNNEPKIVIIVALYEPQESDLNNICNYIKACDLCILKDDSESNHEEYVSGHFDKREILNYEYVWNEKNIGLCASVNGGISLALDRNADWILLMDEDSQIDETSIYAFKSYIKANDTTKIACLAPQYNYDRHPRKVYEGTKKILWANMSGMCINKLCLKDVGLFDERLFIDGLDLDWGIRAKNAGYDMVEIGTIVMNHHPAETKEFKIFGKVLFKYGWANPIRYYYQFRSNLYMIKKYKSFEVFKWQAVKLVKSMVLFANKKEYWKMFKKAIRDCNDGRWGKY